LQRSGEQAALVAAAAEQIQSHWSALLEQISSACGPGLVTERLDSLLVDLLDYARALAGTLILERDPVHIARLLRKALAQACAARGFDSALVRIDILEQVPERVLADGPRLSKILLQVIGAALDDSHCNAPSLVIELHGHGSFRGGVAPDCLVIALKVPAGIAAEDATAAASSLGTTLREALVERLCEHMGGSLREEVDAAGYRCWYLAIPLEPCEDPVHSSELERASAAAISPDVTDRSAEVFGIAGSERSSAGQSAIDFMYLDRQLGSLAQLVLARIAPAFLALAEERLTKLVVAQQMGDRDQIRELAQAWKASAMSVGGRPLASLLGAVEKQAAAGHIPGDGAIRQIHKALEQLQRALTESGPAPGLRL
jgi:hypothetical protein